MASVANSAGANSAVSIHILNVATCALITFREANLSILTYPRNSQCCIVLNRIDIFTDYSMKTPEKQSISDSIWPDCMKLPLFSSSFLYLPHLFTNSSFLFSFSAAFAVSVAGCSFLCPPTSLLPQNTHTHTHIHTHTVTHTLPILKQNISHGFFSQDSHPHSIQKYKLYVLLGSKRDCL